MPWRNPGALSCSSLHLDPGRFLDED